MINSIDNFKTPVQLQENMKKLQENMKKLPDDSKNSFSKTLKSVITHVDDQIKQADKKTEDFALGRNNDLVDVMVSTEKASLSFQFLLQIRNKLLEGYQEIMRMNF